LVSSTVFARLVVKMTCLGKVRLVEKNDTEGRTPWPVNRIFCTLLGALSMKTTAALREPVFVGVKVTKMTQLACAARDEPQLLVCLKSLGSSPPIAMDVKFSGISPVLVRVTDCAVLVIPTVWLPKFRREAENFAAAPSTTWLNTGETLDAKFASPLYVAVMVCVLGPRAEYCKVATPLLLREELPRFVAVAVSKKLTVPVGVPLTNPGSETVAVKVTACP
jgi:hypothetical protein